MWKIRFVMKFASENKDLIAKMIAAHHRRTKLESGTRLGRLRSRFDVLNLAPHRRSLHEIRKNYGYGLDEGRGPPGGSVLVYPYSSSFFRGSFHLSE